MWIGLIIEPFNTLAILFFYSLHAYVLRVAYGLLNAIYNLNAPLEIFVLCQLGKSHF